MAGWHSQAHSAVFLKTNPAIKAAGTFRAVVRVAHMQQLLQPRYLLLAGGAIAVTAAYGFWIYKQMQQFSDIQGRQRVEGKHDEIIHGGKVIGQDDGNEGGVNCHQSLAPLRRLFLI
jgi:hypothetical protein